MDPITPAVIPLARAAEIDERLIGGKAAKLARMAEAGLQVPGGFCVTVDAYRSFIRANRLDDRIAFELGRKPFASLRWEEIWDAALRIRSAFQSAEIPPPLRAALVAALDGLGDQKVLAVRSSAPKEDSAQASFAGLHESYVGVVGPDGLLDAVCLVWASLWSDAALLYQRELGLDPLHSAMAVVVQELVEEDVSGVAFGVDPREPEADRSIIEAVPGLCRDLVDGVLDPDRWILARSTGAVLDLRPGEREESEPDGPLLGAADLRRIYQALQNIEGLFGWHPDVEWTGRSERFTLLQARPITTAGAAPDDDKAYYLTLRPGERRLQELATRVAGELIPQLEAEGERLAAQTLSGLTDEALAEAIESRAAALDHWRAVYWEDFIPFAHGVRHLVTYYHDAVRPADPYEALGLLRGQAMLATRRNEALADLARTLREQPALLAALQRPVDPATGFWEATARHLEGVEGTDAFLADFRALLDAYMDVSFGEARVGDQPEQVLPVILELAAAGDRVARRDAGGPDVATLEHRLYAAVGEGRRAEAEEVLRIGRLSWRLRDDDNILLGRIESQLLRALAEGAQRLAAAGRLDADRPLDAEAAPTLEAALRQSDGGRVVLPRRAPEPDGGAESCREGRPRQLVGQPAAPGLASGRARLVRSAADLGEFRAGEVLVCDAIQPNMTHLVPLAGAIVERRGGMLIHGAIIAREMGIPCVNGVPRAAELLADGDLVTVDGYLGLVTVGAPEFDLELGGPETGVTT